MLKRAESLKVEIRCDLVYILETALVAEWHGSVYLKACVLILFILRRGIHLDGVMCLRRPGLVFFRAAVICPIVHFDELFLLSFS